MYIYIYFVAQWVVLHLMNHLQNLRSCCIQIEFHCVHCVPWNSMVALLETPNRSNFLSHQGFTPKSRGI